VPGEVVEQQVVAEPAEVFGDEIMAEHQVWERIEQFVVGTNAVAMVPAVGVEDVVVDAVVAALAEELLVLGQRAIEPAEEGV